MSKKLYNNISKKRQLGLDKIERVVKDAKEI